MTEVNVRKRSLEESPEPAEEKRYVTAMMSHFVVRHSDSFMLQGGKAKDRCECLWDSK